MDRRGHECVAPCAELLVAIRPIIQQFFIPVHEKRTQRALVVVLLVPAILLRIVSIPMETLGERAPVTTILVDGLKANRERAIGFHPSRVAQQI